MRKIVYIVSDIDHALSFQWIAAGLQPKCDLAFILIGKEKSSLYKYLVSQKIRTYEIPYEKIPARWQQWWELFGILRKERPDTVHCHLWIANLLGLSAAWVLRVRQRVLTRHHATIHYREYPSGRKWDMLCNAMATHIVAISENTRDILRLRDKADHRKIRLIHHGFDFEYFRDVSEERVSSLGRKYDLRRNEKPVIGVISRYLELKGVQYIVPAFKKIREKYPDAKLILANTKGEYAKEIGILLAQLPKDAYTEISFEQDLAALYRLFDVFIHVPVDPHAEAFGQTYIEPLICGIPSVFTLSGIAREFVRDGENALVVDYRNSDQIAGAVARILEDKVLRTSLIEGGSAAIQQFSMGSNILALEKLYHLH